MKKYNKFIPVAVLAGLCFLAVSMNNEECYAEASSTTQYNSVSKNNDQKTRTTMKHSTKKNEEKRDEKRKSKKTKNSKKQNCKNGSCYQ